MLTQAMVFGFMGKIVMMEMMIQETDALIMKSLHNLVVII